MQGFRRCLCGTYQLPLCLVPGFHEAEEAARSPSLPDGRLPRHVHKPLHDVLNFPVRQQLADDCLLPTEMVVRSLKFVICVTWC